jgi:hypothetical protein
MILIVGDNGFSDFSSSEKEEFLSEIGNLLYHKPFRRVKKVIIVNFKDRLTIKKSHCIEFIWIPSAFIEEIDMNEKRRIEEIIRKAKIVAFDELMESESVRELKLEFVRFSDIFFPIEFIRLYRELSSVNSKLIIYEVDTFTENLDRAELFIKQTEKIKPIFDSFMRWNLFIRFIIVSMNKYYFEEYRERYGEEVPGKLTDLITDLVRNYFKKYKDLHSSNSKPSVDYMKVILQRMDYFLEILSTQKRKGHDTKSRQEVAKEMSNSEIFSSMVEVIGFTKQEEIDDFQKDFYQRLTQEPSQEKQISDAEKIGPVLRNNLAALVPEYLFEMLKGPAIKLFAGLKSATSRINIVLGENIVSEEDFEFIRYLVSDALRDCCSNSKERLNAREDDLDFKNRKKDFLIIEEFESLEPNEQRRLWSELTEYQNNFKSVVFICKGGKKLKGSILRDSNIKKAEIPSFKDLKEERYKIFLYLLNRKRQLDRKTIEVYVAIPFHFHEFDSYLDGVDSFPIMTNILDRFEKEIDEDIFSYLLAPKLWYFFEIFREEARKVVAEEIIMERAYSEKPGRYTVICQDKFWEVRKGQRHLMPIPRLRGFDFLFYLIWYGRIPEDKNQQKEESEKGLKRIKVMNLHHNVTKLKRPKKMPEDEVDAGNIIYQSWKNAKKSLKEMLRSNNESGDKKAFIEYLMAFRIAIINYEAAAIVKKGPKNKVSQIEVELGNYFET